MQTAAAQVPGEWFDFPSGYGLTAGTLKQMARAVREAVKTGEFRERCRELFAGLPSFDHAGEIRRVWRHILDEVRYMRDPTGIEWVTRPEWLSRQIRKRNAAEDCDGMTVYAAALFSSCGLPWMFDAQGRDPQRPDHFRHVALVVNDPTTGEWFPFDPVSALYFGEDRFTLGDTIHVAGEPQEFWTVDGERIAKGAVMDEEGDMQGLFGDCGCGLGDTSTADTAFQVVGGVGQAAPAFGPYGMLVGGLATLATGIYDAATGKKVGVPTKPVAANPPPLMMARDPYGTGYNPYVGPGGGAYGQPGAPYYGQPSSATMDKVMSVAKIAIPVALGALVLRAVLK